MCSINGGSSCVGPDDASVPSLVLWISPLLLGAAVGKVDVGGFSMPWGLALSLFEPLSSCGRHIHDGSPCFSGRRLRRLQFAQISGVAVRAAKDFASIPNPT